DVEFLKREIPLDLAEFFVMTPLPGSKDHQKYYLEKVPMEPDTNLYDTTHVCVDHPRMTREELGKAYRDAWKSFYSKEHLRTLLFRRKGPRRRILFYSLIWFCSSVFLENVHPLLGGFFRLKGRRNRRRGFPREPFFSYYWKRTGEIVGYATGFIKLIWVLWRLKLEADHPKNANYTDVATRPEPAPAPTEKPPSLVLSSL
ncbi:MAG: radical SAM protein, partial [Candidatus Omnitrophica bacterium]|nr:radical SAM protein [Candidatus Omnitrophota bacterium]